MDTIDIKVLDLDKAILHKNKEDFFQARCSLAKVVDLNHVSNQDKLNAINYLKKEITENGFNDLTEIRIHQQSMRKAFPQTFPKFARNAARL